MIVKKLILAAAAAGLIAGPTLAARRTPQEQLDKLLAGYTEQKPVDCINQMPTNRSETISGIGIVYTVGTTRYVNRFSDACPQLTDDRILVTRTYGTQLCRGDIARIVQQQFPMEYGPCIFAQFTPYRRAPQAR